MKVSNTSCSSLIEVSISSSRSYEGHTGWGSGGRSANVRYKNAVSDYQQPVAGRMHSYFDCWICNFLTSLQACKYMNALTFVLVYVVADMKSTSLPPCRLATTHRHCISWPVSHGLASPAVVSQSVSQSGEQLVLCAIAICMCVACM